MKLFFSLLRRQGAITICKAPLSRVTRPELERLEDRLVPSAAPSTVALAANYGQLPLAFEVNEGQAAAGIDYLAHGSGYTLDLSSQQAVLNLSGQPAGGTAPATNTTLTMQLIGANAAAPAVGSDQLITKSNYLTGPNASQSLTGITNYGEVTYQGVYQGTDLSYHGNQGLLEYDFTLHPGASADAIQLSFRGQQGLTLDSQGNLVIQTAAGPLVEQAPVAYQVNADGSHTAVASRYVLEGNGQVGFQVGAYDPTQALVIDPTLSYSTYLNGSGNTGVGVAIAVDGSGDAYVVGTVTGSGLGILGGGTFVDKLNAAGTALVYQTFLGNSTNAGGGSGIAVDAAGDVYVTGLPGSNFPTTTNALQPTAPSGPASFITVLDPTGANLLYSTYLPGATTDPAGAWIAGPSVAISSVGTAPGALDNIYVTGEATTGLPTTASAFQGSDAGATTRNNNAFFVEINPNLSGSASLLYGSYLGGSATAGANDDAGTGIAVDASGNAYITGYSMSGSFPTTAGAFRRTAGGLYTAFVAKFNPSLSGLASLVYSTYLGGTSGYDGYYPINSPTGALVEQIPGPGIAVDSAGDAYVTGSTASSNFPITTGAFQTQLPARKKGSPPPVDAFVTKLNASGSALVYSTYLGGNNGVNGGSAIAVDSSGNADVTGWTSSMTFPTLNPLQSKNNGGFDAFVTTLNATGTGLLFSTYLGGRGNDYGYGIALDSAGNAYVTGQTASTNFPTTAGTLQTSASNAFVLKIDPPAGGPEAATPMISAAGIPVGASSASLPLVSQGTPTSAPDGVTSLGMTVFDEWFAAYMDGWLAQAFDWLLADLHVG
jgi:hypothetical protein